MPTAPFRRIRIHDDYFNLRARWPDGMMLSQIKSVLDDTHEFVYSLNKRCYQETGQRIEDILMAATFGWKLSEFIVRRLSEHSTTLTRNLYHNGHPDLIQSTVILAMPFNMGIQE